MSEPHESLVQLLVGELRDAVDTTIERGVDFDQVRVILSRRLEQIVEMHREVHIPGTDHAR